MHLRTSAGLFGFLSIFSAARADASPQEVNLELRSLPGAPVRTAVLRVEQREVSLDQIVRVRIADTDQRRVWSVVGAPSVPTTPSTPPQQNGTPPPNRLTAASDSCENVIRSIAEDATNRLRGELRLAADVFARTGQYEEEVFDGRSIDTLARDGTERQRLHDSCSAIEAAAVGELRDRVRMGFRRMLVPLRSLEGVYRRSMQSLDVNTVQPTPGYSRLAITACVSTPTFQVVRPAGEGGSNSVPVSFLEIQDGDQVSVEWSAPSCPPEAAYTFNIVEPDGPITLTPGFIVPIFVGGATRLFDLGSSIGQESSGAGFAAPQPAVFLHMRLLANSNHHWALGAFLGSSIGSRAGMMWSLGLSLMAYQRLMIGIGAVVDFEGDMRRSSMDEGVSFADSTESFARGGFAINIGVPLDIVRALTPSASTGATQNPASN